MFARAARSCARRLLHLRHDHQQLGVGAPHPHQHPAGGPAHQERRRLAHRPRHESAALRGLGAQRGAGLIEQHPDGGLAVPAPAEPERIGHGDPARLVGVGLQSGHASRVRGGPDRRLRAVGEGSGTVGSRAHRPRATLPLRRDRRPASRDTVRDARRSSRRRAGRPPTSDGADRRRHVRAARERRRPLRGAPRRRTRGARAHGARARAERHALDARHRRGGHRGPADDDAPAPVLALVPARLAHVRAAVDVEAPRATRARLGQARCRAHPVAHHHRTRSRARGAQARHPDHRDQPRDGREHPRLHDSAARSQRRLRSARVGRRQAHVRDDPGGHDARPARPPTSSSRRSTSPASSRSAAVSTGRTTGPI